MRKIYNKMMIFFILNLIYLFNIQTIVLWMIMKTIFNNLMNIYQFHLIKKTLMKLVWIKIKNMKNKLIK